MKNGKLKTFFVSTCGKAAKGGGVLVKQILFCFHLKIAIKRLWKKKSQSRKSIAQSFIFPLHKSACQRKHSSCVHVREREKSRVKYRISSDSTLTQLKRRFHLSEKP